MITVNLTQLRMLEGWLEKEPLSHRKVAFPFYNATGTENSSVVYFELEPGHSLGTHTDSAEEIILILQGNAELSLGEEVGQLIKNEMAIIPIMIPHNVRNIGIGTLKVIGFFSSSNVESTFLEPVMPLNQKIAGAPPIPTDHPLTWNEIANKIIPS
ncbi:cupin domain-containing protein [Bacillus sp. FJAT-29790]|uniref:cupin domain-containing protein n=1 Tax=Bacillus sp. FJAT-29790 TaxID=1895002 RepID=UPI001C228BBE|nr:cupin domain-containing protein [Bacillus sp. FJAT-29790]MBU8878093.1 cupin domain-containing protein [Bacillus sp. FJAT-29790]